MVVEVVAVVVLLAPRGNSMVLLGLRQRKKDDWPNDQLFLLIDRK